MNLTIDQLRDDRELRFRDRGISAVLRPVTETFTPETQQVQETGGELEVTVIPLDLLASPLEQTAGQHAPPVKRFLIRTEDLPTNHPVPSLRLMLNENAEEFDVIARKQSDDDLTSELTCRQRA